MSSVWSRVKTSENWVSCQITPSLREALEKQLGNQLESYLKALARPAKLYFLRVNTLKTTVGKVVKSLREKGFKPKQLIEIPEAIFIEVKGPLKVPIAEKKVIVDREAAEAVLSGAHLYAPGIIEADEAEKGEKVTIYSETGVCVGTGIWRLNTREALEKRRGLAVEVTHKVFTIPSSRELPERNAGLIYPQSIPSMLASIALNPKPGEKILDMCCAPGGKLTHLAQLTRDKAEIIGVDRSEKRLKTTLENLKLLGIKNVKLLREDSRYLDLKHPNWKFDKILLDPPCSALGYRPKLKENKTLKQILGLADYQRQLLKVAVKLLKKNGVLTYSVCTITKEECIENTRYAVEALGLEIEEQPLYLGFKTKLKTQIFYPPTHETPGFYIAKLRKP